MNCSSAIQSMLEAEPLELRGIGDSELAKHLATCEECRSIASEMLAAQESLAGELAAAEPRLSVEEAVRVAGRRRASVSRRNLFLQVGAPLAAAAGLAGIVMFGGQNDTANETVQTLVEETLPGLEVQGPPGKDVAVFEVADRPDVVVVWFFDAGDE